MPCPLSLSLGFLLPFNLPLHVFRTSSVSHLHRRQSRMHLLPKKQKCIYDVCASVLCARTEDIYVSFNHRILH